MKFKIGTIIQKDFFLDEKGQWETFNGTVTAYVYVDERGCYMYQIEYEDGDTEDFSEEEVEHYRAGAAKKESTDTKKVVSSADSDKGYKVEQSPCVQREDMVAAMISRNIAKRQEVVETKHAANSQNSRTRHETGDISDSESVSFRPSSAQLLKAKISILTLHSINSIKLIGNNKASTKKE